MDRSGVLFVSGMDTRVSIVRSMIEVDSVMLLALMISDGSSVDEFLLPIVFQRVLFRLFFIFFSRVSLFQSLSDPLSLYSVWDISNCFIVLIPLFLLFHIFLFFSSPVLYLLPFF